MFRVDAVTIGGDNRLGKTLHATVGEADAKAESFWRVESGVGMFASFRVVNAETGDIYSEWECD